VKLKRALRPAAKARKGRNPFTGEEIMIKAKPATVRVKTMPLKALKEAVSS
jgi:nucleoid DNA-binding protein